MKRRGFLGAIAAPLALQPPVKAQLPQSPGRIKITDLRLVQLWVVRQIGAIEPAWALGTKMNFNIGGGSFLEIHTDQGLIGIGPDAQKLLMRYNWPGNIRELENDVARACIVADGDCITLDELPPELAARVTHAGQPGGPEAPSLQAQRRRFEADVIRRAIEEAGGDRKLAASRLKISLSSLYSKLSETGDVGQTEQEGGTP